MAPAHDDAPSRARSIGQTAMVAAPFVAGVATAIALWGVHAPRIFFATAAEVIALGAVAMAIEGRLFRISRGAGRGGAARASLLISVGVGLAFAFGALARQDGGSDAHLAIVGGALAMGAAGVAFEAIFGFDDGSGED